VQNDTLSPRAIAPARRAVAAWKNAVANGQNPDPLTKPEYSRWYLSTANAGAVQLRLRLQVLTTSGHPHGLADLRNTPVPAGLAGFPPDIDERKLNVDGTDNSLFTPRSSNSCSSRFPGKSRRSLTTSVPVGRRPSVSAVGLFQRHPRRARRVTYPEPKLENIIAPADTLQGTILPRLRRDRDGNSSHVHGSPGGHFRLPR